MVAARPALASGATLRLTDGRVVAAGDVLAVGTRVGDTCSLPAAPDAPAFVVPTDGVLSVRLQVDDDCRLVVSRIAVGAVATASARTVVAQPKWDDSTGSPVLSPTAIGSGISVAGDSPTETADSLLSALNGREVKPVWVSQTLYDAGGMIQYEDMMSVEYVVDHITERLSGPYPVDGYCVGSAVGQTVDELTGLDDPLTTVRNCYYKPLGRGPADVSFRSGGYYRQGVRAATVSAVLDERRMTEHFNAWYGGESIWCDAGGDLPPLWSAECFLDSR